MTMIYSSSAIKTRQREAKAAARKDVARITKNGDGIFMFCSEEIFDERLRQAAEQGAYEERGRGAVRAGHEDVAAGCSYAGLKYAFEAAAALRSAHE